MDSKKYDNNSEAQNKFNLDFLDVAISLNVFKQVAEDKDEKSIFFGDLGCATGLNSIEWIKELLKHTQEREVNLCMSDLISNDFNLCNLNLKKHIKSDKIFPNYAFKSFYEKIYANESLNIAICNNSVHWLSETNNWINEDCLIPQFSNDKEIAEKATKIAEEDYLKFLKFREGELKFKGYLLINGPNEVADKRTINLIWSVWEEYVKLKGIEKVKKYLSFPVYMRTKEELLKPFSEKDIHLEIIKLNFLPFTLNVIKDLDTLVSFFKPLLSSFLDKIAKEIIPKLYSEEDKNIQKERFAEEFFDFLKSELQKADLKDYEASLNGYQMILRKTKK